MTYSKRYPMLSLNCRYSLLASSLLMSDRRAESWLLTCWAVSQEQKRSGGSPESQRSEYCKHCMYFLLTGYGNTLPAKPVTTANQLTQCLVAHLQSIVNGWMHTNCIICFCQSAFTRRLFASIVYAVIKALVTVSKRTVTSVVFEFASLCSANPIHSSGYHVPIHLCHLEQAAAG